MKLLVFLYVLVSLSSTWQPGLEITQPPARWDHEFNGQLVVKQGTVQQTNQWCLQLGGHAADACSGLGHFPNGKKVCIVVVPTDGHGSVAAYTRHEVAHCNGWSANHDN